MAFFNLFGKKMDKSAQSMDGVRQSLENAPKITAELYDEIEEQLILADVGAETAADIIRVLKGKEKSDLYYTGADLLRGLRELVAARLEPETELDISGKPAVILVVGVNGAGKTTSIAKIANYYKNQGKKVLLAAGDTFRAAAQEQLEEWALRIDVPILKGAAGADPSSVLFDAVSMAAARGYDIVICDTAGRLQTQKNLMDELAKISRVIKKASESASIETLLALDAVTGQNAIVQAQQFDATAGVTGIILTKLDGTAKGGSVLSIRKKMGLPVRFVGVGEAVDDLMPFSAQEFALGLFPQEEQ